MSPCAREYANRKLAGPALELLNVIVTGWNVPPVSEPAENVRLTSSGSVSPALVGVPGVVAPYTFAALASVRAVPSKVNVTFAAGTALDCWNANVYVSVVGTYTYPLHE